MPTEDVPDFTSTTNAYLGVDEEEAPKVTTEASLILDPWYYTGPEKTLISQRETLRVDLIVDSVKRNTEHS